MANRAFLFLILVFSLTLQISFSGRIAWFPDLVLIVVAGVGLFSASLFAAIFGLTAGILCGWFSVLVIPANIIVFSMCGVVSSFLGKMFYRHNPLTQAFTSGLLVTAVICGQIIFLNTLTGNDASVGFAIRSSWRTIVSTMAFTPPVVLVIKNLLKEDK